MNREPVDSPWRSLITWVGGGALLFAVLIDAAAVFLRHLKLSIVGSIELVQAAMLIASSAAIVLATLHRRHAMVHLLLNRLGTPSKRRLLQSGCLLGSVFFIFLTIASLLALHDMWGAHEQSDLLHVPYVPLRILSAIAAAAAALALLAQGMRRPP